jgi:hypothetical protein
MDENEHEKLSNITSKTQIKVKEQPVIYVRKDMDENQNERLSKISIRHKFK